MAEKEITDLMGLEVFTPKGFYLGRVADAMLDIEESVVWEILLTEANPELVDGGRDISIPFRWIKSVSDIVVLKYFPGRIRIRRKAKGKRKLRVTKRKIPTGGMPREEWH